MSFVTHEQQSLVWLASPLLGGVRHGFSTRRGGVSPAPWDTLNLGPGRGDAPENVEENYRRFFALAREYTQISELNRDILLTFVEKIEVGPKEYPDGTVKATHRNQPYRQSIRIFYKFIGEMQTDTIRALPVDVFILKQSENLDNEPNSA